MDGPMLQQVLQRAATVFVCVSRALTFLLYNFNFSSNTQIKSNQIKWRICSAQHTEKTEACCALQQ